MKKSKFTEAQIGIAFFGFVLTGRWSNSLFRRLLLAGIATIMLTFIVNYPFRTYWSFYGVLIPLRSSLFCGTLGAHLSQHLELGRQIGEAALELDECSADER